MGVQKSKGLKQIDLSINHPQFQKAKLVEVNNKKYLQSLVGADEKAYDQWKKSLERKIPHSDTLLLPVADEFSRKGFCGNSGTLQINYDNYPYLLTSEIENRRGRKINFDQSQLWYLLFGLLKAKTAMRQVGLTVGDIRPQNIFLNQNGELKISNLLSWPMELNNFQKTMDKQVTYLSPEDLKRLQMGNLQGEESDCSEIFSIGLTVLSAGLLTDFETLYDLKSWRFNFVKADEAINAWKNQKYYSLVLRGVVVNLLSYAPEQRLTVDQLNGFLLKHEDFINKKANFFIDNPPQKLHEGVALVNASQIPVPSNIFTQPVFTSEYKVQKTFTFPPHLNVEHIQPIYIEKPESVSPLKKTTENSNNENSKKTQTQIVEKKQN